MNQGDWRLPRRSCLVAGVAAPWFVPARALPARLTIAFDEGSPPTMYRAPARQAALGIYPAIVDAACASLGWACDLRAVPFKRMVAEMDGGQLWAGAVIRTPEREQRWLFSQPYFLEKLAVFSTGPDYRGLADLAGKRVGVIRGWSYGSAFDAARQRREFQCEDVSADTHNFAKLLRGRLDYVVATELGGRMLLQLPAFEGRLVQGGTPLGDTPIHLAVSRSRNGAPDLLQAFDGAAERLHKDGQIEAIVAREVASAADIVRTTTLPG